MMVFVSDENENKDEPEEEADDSEASIDDGVLDELGDDKVADEADTEGFGHIDEDEDEVEEEPEEEGELEDDAEDVDFDSFDDVDEL